MNVQDAWRRWGPVVGDKWGAGVPSPAQPSAAVGGARERSGQHVTDTAGPDSATDGQTDGRETESQERAEAESGADGEIQRETGREGGETGR